MTGWSLPISISSGACGREQLSAPRRPGQRAGEAGAAAPQHGRRHAPAGRDDRVRDRSSVSASHRKNPSAAIALADWRERSAGCAAAPRRRSHVDRLPGPLSRRPPVLPAATRDPCCAGKAGAIIALAKPAALEAGDDLLGGAAAQQRVDLLEGQRRRHGDASTQSHAVRASLARLGVERVAAAARARLVPAARAAARRRPRTAPPYRARRSGRRRRCERPRCSRPI